MSLPWLDSFDDRAPFPDPETALPEPNGLLAVGGCLSPRRLWHAYRAGIFPWYSGDQPILWWSPDPRCVLYPNAVHVTRSLRKTLRKGMFTFTADTAFDAVIAACAEQRAAEGTWILPEMRDAYSALHQRGIAHTIETWHAGALVGGLYGVAIGGVFCGESMFSTMADASKAALVVLCAQLQAWQFAFIDCQMYTDHLASMGAVTIPRIDFLTQLKQAIHQPQRLPRRWQLDAATVETIVPFESFSAGKPA